MNPSAAVVASLAGAVKRYGALTALDGLDLMLHRGELLALLGPNGAGKSTAIGLLLGLLRADAGRVELFGQDPQAIDARRRIGVMLQSAFLPSTLTVSELLRLTMSYYPAPRSLAESAEMASPVYSTAKPRAPCAPICAMMCSTRSLEVVPGCSTPSTVIRMSRATR